MNLVKAILICLLMSTCLHGAEPSAPVNEPSWLSGSWKLEANGKLIEEHWTTPVGGAMLGMSRTVKNGKMVEFEFLRIEQRDGGLVYVAQPQGAPPTEFKLTSSSESEVVFSNLQHDFPQRIRYRRNQDGSVTARIEDESGKKGMDFNYVRAH
jgi:Domain of unknown function (DUF6265)